MPTWQPPASLQHSLSSHPSQASESNGPRKAPASRDALNERPKGGQFHQTVSQALTRVVNGLLHPGAPLASLHGLDRVEEGHQMLLLLQIRLRQHQRAPRISEGQHVPGQGLDVLHHAGFQRVDAQVLRNKVHLHVGEERWRVFPRISTEF